MAHIPELMSQGVAPAVARMLGANRLQVYTAAGASQEDATPLITNFAQVSAAVRGQGVRLGYASGAALTTLYAVGPQPVLVYPAEDETFNDLAPNAPIQLGVDNTFLAVPAADRWLVVTAGPAAADGGVDEAPLTAGPWGRQSAAWVPVPGEAPQDGATYGRTNAAWAAVPPEAPLAGGPFARQAAAWVAVVLQEAPLSGGPFARQAGAWIAVPPEAPTDGGSYVRRNQSWVPQEAPLTVAAGGAATIPGGIRRVFVTTTATPTLTLPANDCMIVDRTGARANPILVLPPGAATINGSTEFALVAAYEARWFIWDGSNYALAF